MVPCNSILHFKHHLIYLHHYTIFFELFQDTVHNCTTYRKTSPMEEPIFNINTTITHSIKSHIQSVYS